MVTRRMPRVEAVLLPILRDAFPGVQVVSVIPDVDQRSYPLVSIRRIGGLAVAMDGLDRATVEVLVFTTDGYAETQELYMDVRQAIWDAVDQQMVTDAGYLHSFTESVGPMATSSTFDDTWLVQGLIQLGVRPPR